MTVRTNRNHHVSPDADLSKRFLRFVTRAADFASQSFAAQDFSLAAKNPNGNNCDRALVGTQPQIAWVGSCCAAISL
jgi:hypothetical protein